MTGEAEHRNLPPIPDSAGLEMWEWLKRSYLEPEIKRRMEVGRLKEGTVIHRAQVVFWIDRGPDVRLNEEVRGEALAVATRDLKKGEEITTADIGEVSAYVLPEEDADAAHVTMFSTASGISLVFDGAYNARLIESQLEVADEFIRAAETALQAQLLRAFSENAFAATDLLAKAELLSLPDKRVSSGKTHRTTRGLYNQWARLGNTERRFADLLNRLGDLREAARYLKSEFKLDAGGAAESMQVLREMRQHVEEVRPKRALERRRPQSYQAVAARDLRSGQIVGPADMTLFK